MISKYCPEEFRIEVVKQFVGRSLFVADVAKRFDITIHRSYVWIKKFGLDNQQHNASIDAQAGFKLS